MFMTKSVMRGMMMGSVRKRCGVRRKAVVKS
jgi:hypothetical protein